MPRCARRIAPLTLLLAASCSDDGSAPASSDADAELRSDAADATSDGTEDAAAPDGTAELTPYDGFRSATYASLDAWLCHPDATTGPCTESLDVTVVQADGSSEVVPHQVATEPPVDCFYVYPTISADPTPNSDMAPGVEEVFITRTQAGPLTSVCRVFAPVYPQTTVAGLVGAGAGGTENAVAYAGVLDAWKHYVANWNAGRGVILVGHSQGSRHLSRLIAEEVEAHPLLQERLVAAYLAGWSIAVPADADVGGTFVSTPVCRSEVQTGCVVAWASFRNTEPATATALYGVAPPGSDAVCNHPAALDGDRATLGSRFPSDFPGLLGALTSWDASPYADPASHAQLQTESFAVPGLLEAVCVRSGNTHTLSVAVNADPADPRTDDIPGDLFDGWGLHLVDVYLVLDDLVALAREQVAAFAERPPER